MTEPSPDPEYLELLDRATAALQKGEPADKAWQPVIYFLEAKPPTYHGGMRNRLLFQIRHMISLQTTLSAMGESSLAASLANATQLGKPLTLGKVESEEEKQVRLKRQEAEERRFEKEWDRRKAAHVKKRLAMGLSESAGTGKPSPEVLLHHAPLARLVNPKEPLPLNQMLKAIQAAEKQRDAKTLAKLPRGASRLGGLPDLPPDHPWPTYKRKKLPFVAQINLSECSRTVHAILPKDGHLFAFALIDNVKSHRPSPCAVFLYRGAASDLVRAPQPADPDIWPDWGDIRQYEPLPATTKPKGRNPKKRSEKLGDTLGWLFGSMWDCFGTPGEVADERFLDGDDWITLLTCESVGTMQWSDAGHLYFLIRRSDLAKLDFSNVQVACCSS